MIFIEKKLNKSQLIHFSLMKKELKILKNNLKDSKTFKNAFIKAEYHKSVIKFQDLYKRLATKKELTEIYNSVLNSI